MIKISAIISTYNRANYLEKLFNSILSQTIDTDTYEIVIVNNNCTDNTEELCKNFIIENKNIHVTYCIETSQGLSFGRNRGIKESKGEIVTFLDDDAFIAPDFFETTLSFFEKHPEVNAIGGKILLHYLNKKPKWYNPFMASLLGYFNKGDKEHIFATDYFRGSNMSFRKVIFQKHGNFNTSLGRVGKNLHGSEEKELFYRFKKNGEQMWYVPSAIVYHLVPIERTTPEFIKRQAIGIGNSQRQHATIKGNFSFIKSLIYESGKWVITISLFLSYFLLLRFAAAIMLIKFRYWVSKGILKTKK